jgi:hypothetical protein
MTMLFLAEHNALPVDAPHVNSTERKHIILFEPRAERQVRKKEGKYLR